MAGFPRATRTEASVGRRDWPLTVTTREKDALASSARSHKSNPSIDDKLTAIEAQIAESIRRAKSIQAKRVELPPSASPVPDSPTSRYRVFPLQPPGRASNNQSATSLVINESQPNERHESYLNPRSVPIPGSKLKHGESASPEVEESQEARLERLGRQRPDVFDSIWSEIGFVFSISMSQVLSEFFVSGFTVLLPTLSQTLKIPAESSTWPASSFSLVVASFLLIFGRLADMYGGFPVYVAGMAWLTLWSIIAGFSQNEVMLNFCRALQGLGPAAFLPSSVMILGSVYRPGPRKNLVFSIYGACAPMGFFIGIFLAGITAEYLTWGWYFWIGTILSAITAITSYLTIPSDIPKKRAIPASQRPKMDWPGAVLIVSGLILVTFAITDSAHAPQRWKTPYILATISIGATILLASIYIEGWVTPQPFIPASLFRVPHLPALMLALLLTYGSLGIFLLYATFYMTNIMGATPLQIVAWYTPMALGGCLISTFGGLVLHLLPGTLLICIAGTSWIIAPLLFAIAPEGANYWAYIFPSMICATVGIDITFNITNVFITTSLPHAQQGLAGAVIMLLLHLGIAVFLGAADVVNTFTVDRLGLRKSYHAVFWFEFACAAVALLVLVVFVKIDKAKSDLTVEERLEMERIEMERLRGKGVNKEPRADGLVPTT